MAVVVLLLGLSLGACVAAESVETTSAPALTSTASTSGGPTVGYVRITWRQDIDARCATGEMSDNRGADSAVIEVWGPTDDGRWRANMIAPSGETEVVIADVAEDGTVLQSWGTYNQANPMPRGPTFDEVTAFRHVECVTSTPTSRESISISDGPYSPGRLPFPHLIPVGDRRIDVVEVLPDIATDRRADIWRGAEYDVFISSSEPPQGATGSKQSTEYWLNQETGLIDRVVDSTLSTQTGSKESVIEFIERSTRPLDSVSFETTGLQQISNLREFLDDDEPTGTTASSSDSAAPASQTADEADRDGVLLEVAALPFDVRVEVAQPNLARARTRIVTDEGVWIISTPDSDPHEGDPLIGDHDGVYGRDFVHVSMYSEILLLDGSESKILRAFPVTPAATPGCARRLT